MFCSFSSFALSRLLYVFIQSMKSKYNFFNCFGIYHTGNRFFNKFNYKFVYSINDSPHKDPKIMQAILKTNTQKIHLCAIRETLSNA